MTEKNRVVSILIALVAGIIVTGAASAEYKKEIPIKVQMHSMPLPEVGLHVGLNGHKDKKIVKTNKSGFAMFPETMQGEIIYIYAVSFGLNKHGYRLKCTHGSSKPVPIKRGDVLQYFPTEYCEVMLNQLDLTPSFPDAANLDVQFPKQQ